MIKLIIVDDHNLFREGLAAILRQDTEMKILDLAGSVQEALDAVRKHRPDMVLMDFNLPDGTGADATRQILQVLPDCKIVFMTISDREEDLLAAVRAGAVGYLMKNMMPSKLIAALKAVQRGESALSRQMTLQLMRELSRTREPEPASDPTLQGLTQREKDVLLEVTEGKSNQEIAEALVISENTVKYHVHSILTKLNLADRRELARFAREHGIKK